MEQIQTKNASATAVAGMTLLEGFMSESYDFRHNVLADKYEVREKGTAAWRPLTDKGINSIARRKWSATNSARRTVCCKLSAPSSA